MNLGLTQGLHRATQLRGNAIAVTDSETSYSWNTLAERIARLAAVFRKMGVNEGDRVALLAHNDHRSLETFFAAIWAGGIIAPLNSRLSVPEINAQLREVEPKLLVCGPDFAGLVKDLEIPAALLTKTAAEAPELPLYEDLVTGASPIADANRRGDDIACLFFTGGTTGTPKGVMLSHHNIAANSINFISHMGIDHTIVHLHCGPLFHVAAAVRLFSVTQAAGRHVMLPKFDAAEVLKTISEEKITLATLVPTMLQAVMEISGESSHDLSSLQYITYGAATMPESLLKQALAELPHVKFVQSYGMTETSPIATMLGAAEHQDPESKRLRSAGRAALLTEVEVFNPDGKALATGETGEVVVRGPNVMLGYWNRPEATAEALKDGWMHTGDLGYMDEEGYLFIVDRLKDVIITGGENVYSQEVENVITKMPEVSTCAVIGLPDEKWGERVHAVVVPHGGMSVDEDAIVEHCKSQLAGYKCPKSITIRTTPLSLSGANKVLKPQLREELLSEQK